MDKNGMKSRRKRRRRCLACGRDVESNYSMISEGGREGGEKGESVDVWREG